MHLKNKLMILKEAYLAYEKFVEGYKFACRKYCADCCTCNVTITTLEAYYIIDNLIRENKTAYLGKLDNVSKKRFQPKWTFNKFAAFFAQGKEVAEEQCDPSWGRCPFLSKNQCVFYHYRPFGCRCMVSVKCCVENGFAEMDPLLMTANNVFMQFIEHVDAQGFSGNFADVLKWMGDENNKREYEQTLPGEPCQGLVKNMAIPVLMIPPEHRAKMGKLLSSLNSLLKR